MPDWCSNYIEIEGPDWIIRPLWEEVQDKNELLNILCPEPQFHSVIKQKTWRVKHWGTTFDVDVMDLNFEACKEFSKIYGHVSSAWSSIQECLEHFAETYQVKIHLQYWEDFLGFVGEYQSHYGKVLKNNSYTINDKAHSCDIKDIIGEELAEKFQISNNRKN
jgi:hypothetical protein